MVIDVDVLLQAQDLRVADIRAVDERAQKQEREDRQDAILRRQPPAHIHVASTVGDTNRTSIFLTTLFAAASSSTNRASALPRSSFSSCIFASILSGIPRSRQVDGMMMRRNGKSRRNGTLYTQV
jgi:hypothetical protein